MVAKFQDHNYREFLQRRRANSKNAIGLDWQKNNFPRVSGFFVHSSAVVAISRARFME